MSTDMLKQNAIAIIMNCLVNISLFAGAGLHSTRALHFVLSRLEFAKRHVALRVALWWF